MPNFSQIGSRLAEIRLAKMKENHKTKT